MTVSTPRRPLRTALAVPALAALLLTGCGAAEDLAQGAQDAAADKASEVAEGAQSAAASKASELAADAVRTQVCNLVKDGSLSAADAQALEGLIPAAEAAGVPAEVLDIARTVADEGTSAAQGQVDDLQAQACAAS